MMQWFECTLYVMCVLLMRWDACMHAAKCRRRLRFLKVFAYNDCIKLLLYYQQPAKQPAHINFLIYLKCWCCVSPPHCVVTWHICLVYNCVSSAPDIVQSWDKTSPPAPAPARPNPAPASLKVCLWSSQWKPGRAGGSAGAGLRDLNRQTANIYLGLVTKLYS